MAFPSLSRKSADADFLAPFNPEDFGRNQVHVTRGADSGFLFRIDPQPGGGAVILTQSSREPDWEYAFHNARFLLAASPEVKSYDPFFIAGKRLRFALRANPVKRLKSDGNRVPLVTEESLEAWLRRKLDGAAEPLEIQVLGKNHEYFKKGGVLGKLSTVLYSGTLEVKDPAIMTRLVQEGVGPAKGLGCGLLTLARI
jgi:CRISPR system Cascade subunit CasE